MGDIPADAGPGAPLEDGTADVAPDAADAAPTPDGSDDDAADAAPAPADGADDAVDAAPTPADASDDDAVDAAPAPDASNPDTADAPPDATTPPDPPPPGPVLWGPCEDAADCPAGAVCNQAFPEAGGSLCTPLGGLGWLCTSDDQCMPGLSCVKAGATTAKECLPLVEWGMPCEEDEECGPELLCNKAYSSDWEGTCLPIGGVGAACWVDDDCATGLGCILQETGNQWGSDAGFCSAPVGAWSFCTSTATCEVGGCKPFVWKNARQCYPNGPISAQCSASKPCTAPDVCVGDMLGSGAQAPHCFPPGPFGAPCTVHSECASPFQCYRPLPDQFVGVCMLHGGTGTPCGDLQPPCRTGYTCETTLGTKIPVCAPTDPIGPGNLLVASCPEGGAFTDYFGKRRCASEKLQAACASDADCGPGLACATTFGGGDESCVFWDWYESSYEHCYSSTCDGCTCCTLKDAGWSDPVSVICSTCLPAPGSVGEGEPCGHTDDCGEGLRCLLSSPLHVCAPGEPLGAPCTKNEQCASGLTCLGEPAAGTCQPRKLTGEPCDYSGDCVPPLRCLGAHICQPPALGKCGADSDCAAGMTCEEILGGLDGECHKTQLSSVPSCNHWYPTCGTDGYCDMWCSAYYTYQVPYPCSYCVPPPGTADAGFACADDTSCTPDLVCNAIHACAAPLGVGEPCNGPQDCEMPLLCPDGTCRVGAAGESCEDEAWCAPGLRCRPTPSGPACLDAGQTGAACDEWEDCASTLVCLGVKAGDPDSAAVGACGPLRKAQEPCQLQSDCASSLLCAPLGVCWPDETTKSCAGDGQCGPGYVCYGYCCVLQ